MVIYRLNLWIYGGYGFNLRIHIMVMGWICGFAVVMDSLYHQVKKLE